MDLMARMTDAPLFRDILISCFHPLIFSISQLARLFLSRTTNFKGTFSPEKSHAAGQNVRLQTCARDESCLFVFGAGLRLVLSPFPLDASFASARLIVQRRKREGTRNEAETPEKEVSVDVV